MLKVVGASWFQTRISTYLLVAVVLLGIGTFILSEYGRVEDDGTYSATVFWNQKGGYRIEFWGQGNDLLALPRGVARAYYKFRIDETGWSNLEIETNPNYPDEIQAYAAGVLEGSLTWKIIHQHWHNTIRAVCASRATLCKKVRRFLLENKEKTKAFAEKYQFVDPYWHMIRLFHKQLQGLEFGWKYEVHRNRDSAWIEPEDFYYLAIASDLLDLELANNGTHNTANKGSTILLKSLSPDEAETIVAFAKNTAAPYSKMLRLIKKYKFGYHILPDMQSELVPGQSVVMTSFPGALSSHDESYIIHGKDNQQMVVAGIPIFVNNRSLWNRFNLKNHEAVLAPARVMAANRLSSSPAEWSTFLTRHNSGTSNRQWISYDPKSASLWIIEQILDAQYVQDYSEVFKATGFLVCTGVPINEEIRSKTNPDREDLARQKLVERLQQNFTTFEEIEDLMQGKFHVNYEAEPKTNNDSTNPPPSEDISLLELRQIVSYRGDLDPKSKRPIGVIDSIGILMRPDSGVNIVSAKSGPRYSDEDGPYSWNQSFPNISHVGHPEVFNFEGIMPIWVWI